MKNETVMNHKVDAGTVELEAWADGRVQLKCEESRYFGKGSIVMTREEALRLADLLRDAVNGLPEVDFDIEKLIRG